MEDLTIGDRIADRRSNDMIKNTTLITYANARPFT